MFPDSLAVIGLGALGGAIALGAREHGVPFVVGCTRDTADAVAAVAAGAVDVMEESLEEAVASADLVLLAVPPDATCRLLPAIAASARPDAIVTDVASVKGPVMAAAAAAGLGERFVGGHPLAGTHERGFGSLPPDRLRGAPVYLCHGGDAESLEAAARVEGFWRETFAADTRFIPPAEHDRLLGWTSHLPQAASSALAVALARAGVDPRDLGPGARDVTRLAASQSALWTEILMQNRTALLPPLAALAAAVDELVQFLRDGDVAAIDRWLAEAARFRRTVDA